MNDILKRTLKTFCQAFFGIFIPEFCAMLCEVLPADLKGWKMVLIPLVCSSLSAGICAAWNSLAQAIEKTN